MFRQTPQPQPATTAAEIDDLLMVLTTTTPTDGSQCYNQATEHSVRQILTSYRPRPFDGVQPNGDYATHEIYRFTLSVDDTGRPVVYMVEHDNGVPQARASFDLDEFAVFRTTVGQRQPASRHIAPTVIVPAEPTAPHIAPAVAAGFALLTN